MHPLSHQYIGNWFFPNGSRVPSAGSQMDFYRTRSRMVVLLHRRRGGAEGIYSCEIPDTMNVNRTIYIGVYRAVTNGEPFWLLSRLTSGDICINTVLLHTLCGAQIVLQSCDWTRSVLQFADFIYLTPELTKNGLLLHGKLDKYSFGCYALHTCFT